MIITYPHKRGIHCETGTIKNMLSFHGLEVTEEMIFGIGSGYDFINFPFPVFNGLEAPLLRNLPGNVFKQFSSIMNINSTIRKFRNPDNAMKSLDILLEKSIPVGVIAELSLLPFFPLQDIVFPGHTFVVVGKEKNKYIVGDTDFRFPTNSYHKITEEQLKKARFPKAYFSPKGKMFYINEVPASINLKKGVIIGIKKTCQRMLDNPVRFFGVKGIYFYSKRILIYEKKYGKEAALKNLKWYITLAETAGTGGSGYRYLYSSFLKEAAELLNDKKLLECSAFMREIGDKWQLFSLESLRICEGRKEMNMNALSEIVYNIAQMEEKLFKELRIWVKNNKNN